MHIYGQYLVFALNLHLHNYNHTLTCSLFYNAVSLKKTAPSYTATVLTPFRASGLVVHCTVPVHEWFKWKIVFPGLVETWHPHVRGVREFIFISTNAHDGRKL